MGDLIFFKKKYYLIMILLLLYIFLSLTLNANAQGILEFQCFSSEWEYSLENPSKNNEWNYMKDISDSKNFDKGVSKMWFRKKIPVLNWQTPSIYFGSLYSQSVEVYIEDQKIYERKRDWLCDVNKIILPLNKNDSGKTIYILTETTDIFGRIGPRSNVFIGEYNSLMPLFFKKDFINIVFGFTFILLSVFMLLSSLFLRKEEKKILISLSTLVFFIGIGSAQHPNNLGTYFPSFEKYFISIIFFIEALFPVAFIIFFEQIFGRGYKNLISILRKVQIAYSVICIITIIIELAGINQLLQPFQPYYDIFSKTVSSEILGLLYIIDIIILIVTAIFYAIKQNTDARLFTAGFFIFAVFIALDLFLFFNVTTERSFVLWRWGALFFVISLGAILIRRVTSSYNSTFEYSKALEEKNKQLDTMWKEIIVSRDQLAQLNKTLEDRVQTRTLELEKANEELQTINEELQASNDTLSATLDILRKTQNQLVESEKMAALGQLVAGIAHEINTPIAAIRSSIGSISDSLKNIVAELPDFFRNMAIKERDVFVCILKESVQESCQVLSTREERMYKKRILEHMNEFNVGQQEECSDMLVTMGIYDLNPYIPFIKETGFFPIIRMAYIISGIYRSARTINIASERAFKIVFALKSYAHQELCGQMIKSDIIEGIETVLTLYQNRIKQGVEVIKHYDDIDTIYCYPDELKQVWTNLIDNALHAMKCNGVLTIDVTCRNEYVAVSICDTGTGISEEIKEKIFNPFFTTKPQGEGSGLGLNIVMRIVDKHKGKIDIESTQNMTAFTVNIPYLR